MQNIENGTVVCNAYIRSETELLTEEKRERCLFSLNFEPRRQQHLDFQLNLSHKGEEPIA